MNRNSATRNKVAAHRLPLPCNPALMAARIAAVLRPPSADMTSSRGREPCISRRTSSRKDMTAMSFRSHRHYALTQFQRLCLPHDNKAIYELRRRHHPTRPDDGAVSSKIGRTTNGVVTICLLYTSDAAD